MKNKLWFFLSLITTLCFGALLVFVCESPQLPMRLTIAILVAIGSIGAAYRRFMRNSFKS
jgi:uncharacterized membrane protein YccC